MCRSNSSYQDTICHWCWLGAPGLTVFHSNLFLLVICSFHALVLLLLFIIQFVYWLLEVCIVILSLKESQWRGFLESWHTLLFVSLKLSPSWLQVFCIWDCPWKPGYCDFTDTTSMCHVLLYRKFAYILPFQY